RVEAHLGLTVQALHGEQGQEQGGLDLLGRHFRGEGVAVQFTTHGIPPGGKRSSYPSPTRFADKVTKKITNTPAGRLARSAGAAAHLPDLVPDEIPNRGVEKGAVVVCHEGPPPRPGEAGRGPRRQMPGRKPAAGRCRCEDAVASPTTTSAWRPAGCLVT